MPIKHPEFEVIHEENTIIRHPKYPFLFASLDGILVNKETGEKGVLEIKTSEILRSMQKKNGMIVFRIIISYKYCII